MDVNTLMGKEMRIIVFMDKINAEGAITSYYSKITSSH